MLGALLFSDPKLKICHPVAPLSADAESRNPFSADQLSQGDHVYLEKLGCLIGRKNLCFCGHDFPYGLVIDL